MESRTLEVVLRQSPLTPKRDEDTYRINRVYHCGHTMCRSRFATFVSGR